LSVEDQLSLIERQYQATYDMLADIYGNRRYSADYVSKAIKTALAFQRSIELLFEDTKKLYDDKTQSYVQRCADNITKIEAFLRGTAGVFSSLDTAGEEDYEHAFRMFRKVRSLTYEILEDVRLIYALRIYPIEEKMALKSMLTDYGFLEVTKCLDEAETNLSQKHFKDCIDRSREALEKTASSILITENKKPSNYFSTDIGTVSGLGIVDKETKKLIEATYSYLSEVGAHGRGEELTLGDAHYAMKETYMRIDILLKKFVEYQKARK
jgi:hypothetical protein